MNFTIHSLINRDYLASNGGFVGFFVLEGGGFMLGIGGFWVIYGSYS